MKFKKIILLTSIFGLMVGNLSGCIEYNDFTKQIDVFGIKILATSGTPDEKIIHAGNILAQYLDNDEDGIPDNQDVINELIKKNATLFMFKNQREAMRFNFNSLPPEIQVAQDLYGYETNPDFNQNELNLFFDASLEEILHLITHGGYANVYPKIFGENSGTHIAEAMDIARGGYFEKVPDEYPEDAWFTYYDKTCDYSCQITEYTYWALTSILGAQDYPGRLDEIQHEWKLNTHEKVSNVDYTVYAILTNPQYKLPTVLPDGNYDGIQIIITY